MFILFIILSAGFILYALLKPPADIVEEPAANEPLTEIKFSSNSSLPEYLKGRRTLTPIPAEEK